MGDKLEVSLGGANTCRAFMYLNCSAFNNAYTVQNVYIENVFTSGHLTCECHLYWCNWTTLFLFLH